MPTPDLDPTAVRQALNIYDDWLALRRRYLPIPGVQAAVWYDGGVALSTAHGHADVERDAPLSASHLFRIASHTKTVTATIALQLVEEGALRLDDRCGTLLPDCSAALSQVTVRELLQHTSGLVRDGLDGDFWQLADTAPEYDPSWAADDTTGYSALAYADDVIESVRGQSATTMVPLDRFNLPARVSAGWRS